MNLLIFTQSAWDETNSIGSTLSNIFNNFKNGKIAHLYCRAAQPNNNVCVSYYNISDKDLLKNVFSKKKEVGKTFNFESYKKTNGNMQKKETEEERVYNFFRKRPSVLAKWGREMLWKTRGWKNNKLENFLKEFSPDIIFAPCFSNYYPHEILWYIQTLTKAKVVLFHADDYLSYKGLNSSPLDYIDKIIRANIVKKSIKQSNLNYCISEEQKEEYEKKTGQEMKILFKGGNFNIRPATKKETEQKPVRIVYMGTTAYGRWKTLAMVSEAIQKLNKDSKDFDLSVYSQYKPSKKELKAFALPGASDFMGKVDSSKVPEVLSQADIVLHVESFEKKERLKTRLSFSTKIVDCLKSAKAVLAVGWEKAASINYFVRNDAGFVAANKDEIIEVLQEIKNNRKLLDEYSQKAWHCGKKNHQIETIQKSFYNDLESLLNKI